MKRKKSFRKTSCLNFREICLIWQKAVEKVNLKERNQVKYQISKTFLSSRWTIMARWQSLVPSYSTARSKLFTNAHFIGNKGSSSNAWLTSYKRVIWSSSRGYRVSLKHLKKSLIYCLMFMKTLVVGRSILTLLAWCKEIWSKSSRTKT